MNNLEDIGAQKNIHINPDYVPEPEKVNVKKGLEGVVIDTTKVSKVNPDSNSLIYRGYPVQDLAENCSFEEVAYLLLQGELPTLSQLKSFKETESQQRGISKTILNTLKSLPKETHPMDAIRTSVSILGCEDIKKDSSQSQDVNFEKAIQILAKIPTMVAAHYRLRQGKSVINPRTDLSFAENFFHMCFQEIPEKEIVKAFDVSLILYAEHSFNASTFTTRVVTSTQSDIYSATVAGIGALKGSLHGGANEQVMYMMLEIDDPNKAEKWMNDALVLKKKVMGFGHRVYKSGDSRVPTMKKYLQVVSDVKKELKWIKMYDALEKVMIEKKNIYPNLDFPTGPAYFMMGFDIDFFTPIFVIARTAGWSAHIIEQHNNNRLIRPLSEYVGEHQRKIIPLKERR
ncbi:bifunctional 2-methylcitrate synthase/citrate synthase [Fluviispira sanaruensis]|uniref:Citrate synthase n=1 Tax=Fluviispira sanaruensis TaxID=2493639 RepID=A0A4P2VKN7_FLUSA|nr:bifunctional 2-methylcitrate synthase/citrate synthase [Fluviispira sanaruensis]BBH51859.1 2-methylcitrate synthase [Fluviispira sanaruensis]